MTEREAIMKLAQAIQKLSYGVCGMPRDLAHEVEEAMRVPSESPKTPADNLPEPQELTPEVLAECEREGVAAAKAMQRVFDKMESLAPADCERCECGHDELLHNTSLGCACGCGHFDDRSAVKP